mmetsp:Transcript_2057/g.4801  ORF Transcript_2057/g.4801 Transcript_2057/m.4801 type:complete len:324 (+) Transcript_2057:94-1065(+)|eukprot:CAMPEP_0178998722 /NCGR_PEP_ID=MMETSP0795-20121207/9663_1 /TAXON_ID=88552 /ORGANISM="Amoebophrya sp., Strain Ameob2" /LENGTH=323 /DNA_ID=CAMNT_0020691417 /DNA_START=83 /DNA_END=1057 /DNA_ORIENTATION=-
MKLLSLGGVALAGLSENGGVAALVVRKKAAAHQGKKSVAGLNLKKSHASKKFIDQWHPKMSFVQYKRQDCTNGMHALKVALPCVKDSNANLIGTEDVTLQDGTTQTQSVLAGFYGDGNDETKTYSDTQCPDTSDIASFARGKYPEMHAILTLAEGGGQNGEVKLQLDFAAEMCSKNKDCGGFVQINMDQAAAVGDGLDVKILKDDGSYAKANDGDDAPTTYSGNGAKVGDIVFLNSSPECATILFLNEQPETLCESQTDFSDWSEKKKQRLCHSACVRASHCKEDPKENTYIKKRIIMSDFGSATETANTDNGMFEGMPTPAP